MRISLAFVCVAAGCLFAGVQCNPSDPTPTNTCAAPTGPGVQEGSDVTTDTTWTAADSPHIVTSAISIATGATLTLDPCAQVRIQNGHGITVNGSLVANGTSTEPVTIDADDVATPWSYIRTTNGASISLAYTTLQNGGDPSDPNGLGMIDVRGDGVQLVDPILHVDHVTIDTSSDFGVVLRNGGAFTADSTALTIRGAVEGPIRSSVALAGTIPDGTYTGNTVDEIQLLSDDVVAQDTTYHDRGVPYRLGDTQGNSHDMRVGEVGTATTPPHRAVLTIEAGVTIKVSAAGRILMQTPGDSTVPAVGALVAAGTSGSPVVFTSAEPAPAAGDWVGLYFAGVPDSANSLTSVQVEYAGGPSFATSFHCDQNGTLNEAEDAAIIILGLPSASFVTASTITASAGYGIDRGWSGATIDFAAGNTFSQMAICSQSFPRDTNGACPASAPCN